MVDKIIYYISLFLAVMVVLSVHEFAHGFAAVRNGDMTPKIRNRYTLNPFAHFDLIGLVCFVFAHFGWAKPMPVNPNNFRHYKRGCFWVSIAGVLANYLLAFVVYPLPYLILKYVPTIGYFTVVLYLTFSFIFTMCLSFFVFNLLPIYPLDGFRVVDVFCKRRGRVYWFLRTKGIFILYALFGLSIFAQITGIVYFNILGIVIEFVVGIIEVPIKLFWGLII